MMFMYRAQRCFLLAFCLLLFASPLTLPAHASKSAAEFFEPVITHRQFSDLVRNLDLNREQRMLVELVFSDYADTIASLSQQADAEADTAGRQTILDAYSGRRLVDPSQLSRLRLDVLQVYRSYWQRIDRELSNLTDNLRSLLSDEQRPLLEVPLRQLRREMLLHPQQVGRNAYEYAGDGLDMLQLITEASRENGELHNLPKLQAALAEITTSYELQLDQLLTQTAADARDIRMEARIARIKRDPAAQRHTEEQSLQLWRQLYNLNHNTMHQVSQLLANTNPEAQIRWERRFYQACFPWLYAPGPVDRRYQWITRQSLTDQQHADAAQIYQNFQTRRYELHQKAIKIMLTARNELQMVISAMMDQSQLTNPVALNLHQQLLHNSGELSSAEATATAELESLLSDNLRLALRRAMRR